MCYRKSFHPHWGMDKEKFMHGGHFGRHFGGQMARHPRSRGYFPPVNVLEADDKYELYVYAPGLAKSDFNINLKDDVLTIATRRQESDLAAPFRYLCFCPRLRPAGTGGRPGQHQGV